MVQKRRTTPQVGAVSASPLPTTKSRTVYATDTGPAHALSGEAARRAHPNEAWISVGSEEHLPHGTLRCEVRGDAVVVELTRAGRVIGRTLTLVPRDKALLRPGARIPEAAFSAEVSEFIGTPWHEVDYSSVWTVHGLRKNGEMELSVER